MWRQVLGNIMCNLDPKVMVQGKNVCICDGVPSTAVYLSTFSISFLKKIDRGGGFIR